MENFAYFLINIGNILRFDLIMKSVRNCQKYYL